MPLSVHAPHVHSHHRRMSLNRTSGDESRPETAAGEDETVVEPDQGNVLSHIISQLRPGADLSRVVLPTFILEPRSMLERITNFMAHPENMLPISEIDDPVRRFVSVVKFYLSGWHIKPPGVKKPLNPILGETFTCYWEFPDQTRGYYISEQTSHHPPKSSYFYMAPEHNIRIDGAIKPRSKFLGNSAASMMEGIAILRLMNRGTSKGGEKYFLTQPNMYARGILFGKMKYELGDHSFVRCPENHLSADIEFKTKGYFGGTYNAIGGTIKNEQSGDILYEISGMWSGEMSLRDVVTGHKEILFDATNAKHSAPIVRPLEEQNERESQKLWYKTVIAINERNHDAATDEKTKVEEMQRLEAAKRAENGVEWHPRLFRKVRGGLGGSEEGEEDLDWILNSEIDGPTPEAKTQQILEVAPILLGQPRSDDPLRSSSAHRHEHAQPIQLVQSQPHSDLIDFGQNDPVAASDPESTQQPTHQSTHQSTQQPHPRNDITHIHKEISAPQPLQEPLDPVIGHPLVRLDTETSEVDEFVDAKS